jgi:autotransporter-associated beta strand protein
MKITTRFALAPLAALLLIGGNHRAWGTTYTISTAGNSQINWTSAAFGGSGTSGSVSASPSSFNQFVAGNTYNFTPSGTGYFILNVNTANASVTFPGTSLKFAGDPVDGDPISLLSAGAANVELNFSGGPLIFDGGAFIFNTGSGGSKLSGNVTADTNGAKFNLNGNFTGTVSASISGAGGATLYRGGSGSGTGTLILSGSNSYSGNTSIGDGKVTAIQLGSTTAIPYGAGKGNVEFKGALAHTLDLNGNATNINGLVSSSSLPTISGRIGSGSGAVSLTLGNGDANGNTYAGKIVDGNSTLSLTKVGTGTQTLSGANTYTGLTKISGGTLALSGSGTISDSLDLDTGALSLTSNLALASLVGNGTITGSQTVTVNSTFSPGHSIGQIGHTGDFTLGSGSTTTMEIDVAGNLFDQLTVSNALTYGGALNVLLSNVSTTARSTFSTSPRSLAALRTE